MNEPAKKRADFDPAYGTKADAADARANRIIIGTICASLLSVVLSVGFLMPFLTAAVLAPFFFQAMKRGDVRTAFDLALRWGAILFVCISLLSVYLPGRTAGSVAGAERCIHIMAAWVTGADTATPLGPVSIAAGMTGIALVSLLSGGLGAIIIGAGTLGCAACAFVSLVRHGDNILQMAVLGNPPWFVAFCLAGLFLLIPTAQPFYRKLFDTAPDTRDGGYLRTRAVIGAVLLLAGIACVLLLGGAWRHLLNRYTVW